MTPLRQKFISSLELQNYSPKTVKRYTRVIERFAQYYHKCPSLLGPEEVSRYLLHLRDEKRLTISYHKQAVASFRFLYSQVLGQAWMVPRIPYPRRGKPLRDFLTPEDVKRVLAAVNNLKYRTMIEVLYGTGVRCGELVSLRVSDIDSNRMVVVVRDGKGHKGRLTILGDTLLTKLRDYYREYRPKEWLFEGIGGEHISVRVPQLACRVAERESGIGKKVTPHVLRRSFATALHDNDVDVITISRLLGHAHLRTTQIYTNVSLKKIHTAKSPLDLLS